jgi:hypothetical protein
MASPTGCATICASSPDPFFEVRQQAAALKENLGTNRSYSPELAGDKTSLLATTPGT